jgi:hypothetical protein
VRAALALGSVWSATYTPRIWPARFVRCASELPKLTERVRRFSSIICLTKAESRLKIKDAVRKLASEILTIEAEGSYDKAKALLEKYGIIRRAMQDALDKLKDVPVDIEPNFLLAKGR